MKDPFGPVSYKIVCVLSGMCVVKPPHIHGICTVDLTLKVNEKYNGTLLATSVKHILNRLYDAGYLSREQEIRTTIYRGGNRHLFALTQKGRSLLVKQRLHYYNLAQFAEFAEGGAA
jgi:DNA-binding PadR family transcriptional regulator